MLSLFGLLEEAATYAVYTALFTNARETDQQTDAASFTKVEIFLRNRKTEIVIAGCLDYI